MRVERWRCDRCGDTADSIQGLRPPGWDSFIIETEARRASEHEGVRRDSERWDLCGSCVRIIMRGLQPGIPFAALVMDLVRAGLGMDAVAELRGAAEGEGHP